MKKYNLTNTSDNLIELLKERRIEHVLEGKTISLWLPSDQFLFMLAQDYEQQRNESLTPSQQLKKIWE